MKKRIISALLCLITVLSLFTTAFATDNLPVRIGWTPERMGIV